MHAPVSFAAWQVGVVAPGQPLCVWARQQAMIRLQTVSCRPAEVVRPSAGEWAGRAGVHAGLVDAFYLLKFTHLQ